MLQFLFLCLAVHAGSTQVQVEVRNSEIWLFGDGHERQLTRDGKSKLQAVLSPSGDRIAYYEQCPTEEHCTPAVVILDLEGRRISTFQPMHQAVPPAEPCGSILWVAWAGNRAVAAVCHINPSLSEYIETDLVSRRVTRDLLGFDFTPSPDGKLVAHVGWIVHFAPPFAQSHYLQVDHATIYPLPKGMRAIEQKGLTEAPEVVLRHGLKYSGIHEFMPGLHWSPDGRHIALIDCTYDWTANQSATEEAPDGVDSNRHCSVAVVSLNGEVVTSPLTEVSVEDLRWKRLTWDGSRRLSFDTAGSTRTITVR